VCISKKRRVAAAAVQAPAPKKTSEKQKRVKGSSHTGDQTSEHEKALAKP
jgi:hypothetical protein